MRMPKGKGALQSLPTVLALAVMCGTWLIYFSPVLLRGESYMGFQIFPDARVTGLAPENVRRSVFYAFPNQDPSIFLIHYPYYRFIAGAYHQGVLPLWNPNLACGYPSVADPQYKLFNPFMLGFYLNPSPNRFWLGIGLEALFGMLGFYFFLRKIGLGPLLSACWASFAVFNPWTQQMMLLSSVWADWLLGWALLGAWYAARGPSRLALIPAAFTALFLYCGHPEEALMLSGVVFLAYWGLLAHNRRDRRTTVASLASYVIGVAGLTAVVVLPFVADYHLMATYKTHWAGVGGYLLRDLFDPRKMIWVPPLVWALALLGLFTGRRAARFGAGLVAAGSLVQFYWPVGDHLRQLLAWNQTLVAVYAQTLFWFGLIWLAILGTRYFLKAEPENKWKCIRSVAYGYLLYFGIAWAMSTGIVIFWPAVNMKLTWLVLAQGALALAAAFTLKYRQWFLGAALALMLVLPALLPMAPFRFLTRSSVAGQPPSSVVYLRDNLGPHQRFSGTLLPVGNDQLVLSPNQALFWNLRDIRMFSPFWPRDMVRFDWQWDQIDPGLTGLAFSRTTPNLMRFLGVQYLAAPHGAEVMPGLSRCYSGKTVDIWSLPGRAVTARMVYRWLRIDDLDRAFSKTKRLVASGAAIREAVVSGLDDSGPPAARAPAWNISWVESTPNELKMRVTTSARGLLVLTDTYYPGWRAQIDGAGVPIYRTDGTFRGVVVPPGRHVVEMRFVSRSFEAGMALSVLFWLLCAAAAVELIFFGRRSTAAGDNP